MLKIPFANTSECGLCRNWNYKQGLALARLSADPFFGDVWL
jgi:hypothetical protein